MRENHVGELISCSAWKLTKDRSLQVEYAVRSAGIAAAQAATGRWTADASILLT